MIKKYVTTITFFLVIPFLSLASVIDSYDVSNQSTNQYMATGQVRLGQCFTVGSTVTLGSASLNLARNGSTTGNYYFEIYASTGSYGTSCVATGSVLATSDTGDSSTLTALPTFTWITLNFSGGNQITLNASTNYVLVVYHSNSDDTNNLRMGVDSTSPTHGGNFSINDGSWTAYSGTDAVFSVDTVSATPTPLASISYASNSFSDIDVATTLIRDSLYLFITGLIFSIWYFRKRNKHT